jgi:hypothetical protein
VMKAVTNSVIRMFAIIGCAPVEWLSSFGREQSRTHDG